MKKTLIALLLLLIIFLFDYGIIKYDRYNIEKQIAEIMHNKEEVSDAVFGDINKYNKEPNNRYTFRYTLEKEGDNPTELVYHKGVIELLKMFGKDTTLMPLSSYTGAYKTVALIKQGNQYIVKESLITEIKIKNNANINFKRAIDRAYNIMLHGTTVFPNDSYIPNSASNILSFPYNIQTIFHRIYRGFYKNGTKKNLVDGAYAEDGYMLSNIDTVSQVFYIDFDIDDFSLIGSVFYLIIGSLIIFILLLVFTFKRINAKTKTII